MDIARMELRFSEREFWRMTMRKFVLLYKMRIKNKYPQQQPGTNKGENSIGENDLVSIDSLNFL